MKLSIMEKEWFMGRTQDTYQDVRIKKGDMVYTMCWACQHTFSSNIYLLLLSPLFPHILLLKPQRNSSET